MSTTSRWRGMLFFGLGACKSATSAPSPAPAEPAELAPAPAPAAPRAAETTATGSADAGALSREEVAALTARVSSLYLRGAPFTCDFDSKIEADAASTVRVHLFFERAGRFHMQFSTGLAFIVDGGKLTISDPARPGVVRKTVADDYLPAVLAFASRSFGEDSTGTRGTYATTVLHEPNGQLRAGYFIDASEIKAAYVVAPDGRRQMFEHFNCRLHASPQPELFAAAPGPTLAAGPSPLVSEP